MKSLAQAIFLLALTNACVEKNPGSFLLLQDVVAPAPAPTCTYDSSSTTVLSYGALDMSLRQGYFMAPRLFNNATAQAPVAYGPITNIEAEQNQIYIDGFYVCYEVRDITDSRKDPTLSCKDLHYPHSGYIGAAATVAVQAKVAFPGLFLPPEIFNELSPSLHATSTILVHLQASGRTQDGRHVLSNELIFPVNLCVGCLNVLPSAICQNNVVINGSGIQCISCPAGQIPDSTSVCNLGQDIAEKCVTPTSGGSSSQPTTGQ